MKKQPIYLDYNATTPLRPEAREAMSAVMAEVGNPSSVHSFGRTARARLEQDRASVAALVSAKPVEVVFTSGGTEANATALYGFPGRKVLVSAVEHDSILANAAGLDAEVLPVDSNGLIDLDALENALSECDGNALVSIMWANNETGVLQPISRIVEIARSHGALVHSDAIQAAGKLPVDFAASECDLISISSHKLGGPAGVGALVIREGLEVKARQVGGGQERGVRSGTENLIGLAGFGAAADAAGSALDTYKDIEVWRDQLEAEISKISNNAVIHGKGTARLPNTSCVSMSGVPAETQVMAFDLDGIAVSAGSACSSGKVRTSHVLEAMCAPEGTAATSIRISLGWQNERADIDRLVATWAALYNRTRS